MTSKASLRNQVDRLTAELAIANAKVNRLTDDVAHHKGRTERAEKDRDRYRSGLEELRTKIGSILKPKAVVDSISFGGGGGGGASSFPSIILGASAL
ncbi:hypothetical protein PBI_DUMBO_103 [Mycobacterium phage Dumbo]|uniref:hypothetical protein n=1 Tax=Mycobacterium phage Dumbo TaxID=1327764 RepID=UPI000332B880|nr:hypothetical protein PBI_DUMBO_103 [Mycobacterium phage Dumbo]AGM12844.1 hypothetical protein PBI_DUMBO_103 [Mycobacterium phage Dumbo]